MIFYKYQGAGNDFIMIDNRQEKFPKNDNTLIAFIIRNNKQIFPNGDDEIKVNDNVVVVSYQQKIEHIDDILARR